MNIRIDLSKNITYYNLIHLYIYNIIHNYYIHIII